MQRGSCSPILSTMKAFVLVSALFGMSGNDRQVAHSAEPPASENALRPPLGVPNSIDVTGVVEEAHLPTTQPKVLWTVSSLHDNGRGLPLSDPAVADGYLYFGDLHGRMKALRTADQKIMWTHLHDMPIKATPSVDNEFVFFGSRRGVTAIRRDNGEQVWNHPLLDGAIECTPLVIEDRVFVSASDGYAYCLNRKDGEIIWKSEFLSDGLSAKEIDGPEADAALLPDTKARPIGSASNGSIFLQSVFDQARVIAFDCETGERRWTFQTEGWIGPAPTIYDDRVYFASEDCKLYCLELVTGKLVWKYDSEAHIGRSRVAVHREKVYLPALGPKIVELDAEKGNVLRTFEPHDPADRMNDIYSFPLIANDAIYFASVYGLLFAFDLQSGEML